MSEENPTRYPSARMDALYDGIFAVAMTLLVLDIRLPEDFHPATSDQLLAGLVGLWSKLWPYALSFFVLGLRWLAGVQVRGRIEAFSGSYIHWWLFNLMLITCVPFSTIVLGRYASLAPAIWLYAGNTALIAVASLRLLALTPELQNEHHRSGRRVSLLVLLGSALLSIAWSLFDAPHAPWAYLLNLCSAIFVRWRKARVSHHAPQ